VCNSKLSQEQEECGNFIIVKGTICMARRNIVHKNFEDRFSFASAYKVFVDFAKELALKRMASSDSVNAN
jgi:hypothetical protein